MSHKQNAGKNHSSKTGNKSLERVEHFTYLRTTQTNENCVHGEIKRRLKSEIACYHSAQNVLSSSVLSKIIKIKIYRTIILTVVLYGCGTWPVTLREEHRRRVCENRVLSKIFGPKRDEVTGEWRRLHNEELRDLYSSPKYFPGDQIQKNEMFGACGMYGGVDRCVQGFGWDT
jgi:hypothetical protein